MVVAGQPIQLFSSSFVSFQREESKKSFHLLMQDTKIFDDSSVILSLV